MPKIHFREEKNFNDVKVNLKYCKPTTFNWYSHKTVDDWNYVTCFNCWQKLSIKLHGYVIRHSLIKEAIRNAEWLHSMEEKKHG